ncbi:methyltransferase domain-containing protein [Saccharopolyspora sp. SCSIO 74807]|uniref:methyltransferase domain-containing protein n=1 Tax=Saccharopolyspora sp. SCSIO 74807 TaxID=3118084 RepID=UPI0030D2EE9E
MPDWCERLAVPRAAFIPAVIWDYEPETDEFTRISRDSEPARWHGMVAADQPITTQLDDGQPDDGQPHDRTRVPSSSCSQPSLVADMLDALDVRPGHRVLEIGTGTGWNAALLCERVGGTGQVVSVEIDPAVADNARRALAASGHAPLVITADGAAGYPPGAPYDRVLATASVRAIARTWIEQSRPGGRILAPWGTDYGEDALTALEVHADGSASGSFGQRLAFMRMRGQRRGFLDPAADELDDAERSSTAREPLELFEMVDFSAASFTIGLRVPDCYLTVEDTDDAHRLIELHDIRSHSWARVTMVRGEHPWTVHQLGPRRLWDEADTAYSWWQDAGKPAPDQYELTIAADGAHSVRLPGRHWRLPLRPGS